MPRILKTILPRIRKSIEQRGLLVSMQRSVLLPIHLFHEYRAAGKNSSVPGCSDFDRDHDVDTDGQIDGWTYLSDLEIPSANWIYGANYTPIHPHRCRAIFASLAIRFEEFSFIDFGSGKGRAVLLASEYPFKRIIGIEFSPELHRAAQQNIQKYSARHLMCGPAESVCMDFLDFPLPDEPSVFFFFDPCEDAVLIKLLRNIRDSLTQHPRQAYLIYVAPTASKKVLLNSISWLTQLREDTEFRFFIYRANDCGAKS